MKRAALIAFALALIMAGALVFSLVNTRLHIRPLSAQVLAADSQPQEFMRLQQAIENRSLIGTAFVDELPGEAKDYRFVVYTLAIHNRGFLPAEMVELHVSPAAGDMASYTDLSAQGRIPDITVSGGSTGSVRCVLLTRADSRQSTVRELFVSYHIWGHPFTIKLTYG